jgi:glucarate dehydratase
MAGRTPTVARVEVVPIAGYDSMLLNLSGAHGPYFTRTVAIVTDSAGNVGVGEVPGGEAIRRTIEEAGESLPGRSIAEFGSALRTVSSTFAHGLGARDDAVAMQYLLPGWQFDPKRPALVR